MAEFAVALDQGTFGFFVDGVEVEAGGHDDGADRFDDQVVLLLVVHGTGAADLLAQAAFAGLELDAVLPVDDRGVGDGLGEGDVDGRPHAQVAVELVGDLPDRAFLHADAAAGTGLLDVTERALRLMVTWKLPM